MSFPKYIFNYGLIIQYIGTQYISAILYFPDVDKVMYCYSKKRFDLFEDKYCELLNSALASQLYLTTNLDGVFLPEDLYNIVSNNKDVICPILELDIYDLNYKYKIEMYKIYIDWYNNYYLSDNTHNWKQIVA